MNMLTLSAQAIRSLNSHPTKRISIKSLTLIYSQCPISLGLIRKSNLLREYLLMYCLSKEDFILGHSKLLVLYSILGWREYYLGYADNTY